MAVTLTDEQFLAVKSMAEFCGVFADQLYKIIVDHELDKVSGFVVDITVDPSMDFVTKKIEIGQGNRSHSAGYIRLTKGKKEDRYAPTGKNSAEYECLFADPEVAERMRGVLAKEKPLPADGMWLGDDRNDPPLDSNGHEIRFDDLPKSGESA